MAISDYHTTITTTTCLNPGLPKTILTPLTPIEWGLHMREESIIRDNGGIGVETNSNSYYRLAEPSKDMPKRKEWVLGIKVRVRPEVEEVLRQYAKKTGWLPHSVRNVAILVGLIALASGLVKFPENIRQYEKLLKEAVETIERMSYDKESKKESK